MTVTYTTPIVNTDLKVPVLGITDLGYTIAADIKLWIVVRGYTTTYLRFQVQGNTKANLNLLKLTYMAIDNTFTPAFSMNYFIPVTISSFRESIEIAPLASLLASMLTLLGPQEFFLTLPTRMYFYPSCTTSTAPPMTTLLTSTLTSYLSTVATIRLLFPLALICGFIMLVSQE